jgi:hypothetical protein
LLEVASLVVPALVAIPRRPHSPSTARKIPLLVVASLVVAVWTVAV